MRGKAIAVTVLLLFLSFGTGSVSWAKTPQPLLPLPGSAIPQFVDDLPLLNDGIHLATGTNLTITMCEFKANVMPSTFVPFPTPANPAPAPYTGTYVWGYILGSTCPTSPQDTYINPVVLATRGTPTKITWVNDLPTGAASETYWEDWVDVTLHWAMGMDTSPTIPPFYTGLVPAVPHLHGGEVPPQLDGGPDAWFLSDGSDTGHAYWQGAGNSSDDRSVYNYPNTQEAAPIWFHDHALGITRLNVYAGIAGAYLLLDSANPWPITAGTIIPLVIQDRMFDAEGQLFMPNAGDNPGHPVWVAEFLGDVIVVNGKVWPKLTLNNKRYAFWFLNGSNARTYNMFLTDMVSGCPGPPIWVIGTDGGLLDAPVKLDPTAAANNSLTMMPGERYLAIIDFAGYEQGVVCGKKNTTYSGQFLLKNNAKTPFPAGVTPDGNTTGRIMKFVVGTASTVPDEAYNPALKPGDPNYQPLRDPMIRLVNQNTGTPGAGVTVHKTRQLTLNEVMGAFGPFEALVNNTKWDGHSVHKVAETKNGVTFDANGIRSDFVQGPDGNTYYSELPNEGETELWEVVNMTADAHPIHLHLVQFQLLNRQGYNVNKYTAAYDALFPASPAKDPATGAPYSDFAPNGGVFIGGYGPPLNYDPAYNAQSGGKWGGNPDIDFANNQGKSVYLQGPASPPLPQEAGWKDTVIMYPGQVTRILVRWAPTDIPAGADPTDPNDEVWFPFNPNGGHGYVWHCHIIDHEDNEMMRPTSVDVNPACEDCRVFTDY